MKLLRLVAWTVWFMLPWAAFAHAEPVSLIISAIALTLKAGGIGAMLIKAAFGIALKVGASLLQQAMAKTQPQPGITGQLQVGGSNSLSFIVGSYATAGSLEYVNTGSVFNDKTPNNTLVQVVTLSDLPVTAIRDTVWVNGEKCTRSTSVAVRANNGGRLGPQSYPLTEYKEGDYYFLFARYFLGDQTAAFPELVSLFGSDSDKPWQTDMIGRGVAYVALSSYINRKLFTSLPSARYEVDGIKLYDPRKDSTVGGSGSHRWGQPETYEFSANPVVIIYNLLRGIWYEGELVYGPGIPAARLPLDNWFASMNECDIPVALSEGGTEPQFRAGYEIKTAEHQPIDVIQELLKTCNGKMAEIGGTYKVHVGAPGLPVYFVTDEDFVVTEEQEFDPFPGLENTFNGASATYPDPAGGWEMKDAPLRLFPDYEEQDDGRRLLADFQFNAATSPTQVQRLMTSMVQDGRRFRKHRGTLPPSAFVLEPLDVIAWTSVREGYISKLFPIDSMDDLVNANQAVAIHEADPSDFDWEFTDELPWTVGPLVPTWPPTQVMTGWSVEPAEVKDSSGAPRRPSIKVNYPGDMEDVSDVVITVRLAEDGSQAFYGKVPYGPIEKDGEPISLKSVVLNGTFLPNEDYEVEGAFVPFSGRGIEPTGWMAVKTPDIKLGPVDIYIEGVVEGVIEIVDDNYRFMGPGLRELIDDARRLAASLTSQDFANYRDKQQLRIELKSSYEQVTAEYQAVISAATGPGSAIVQRLETLEVEMPGKASASAVLLLSSRVDTVEGGLLSVSEAVTSLNAAYGDISASANLRMSASAGPSGYAARIAFEARAGGAGAFRAASLFIDVPSSMGDPTRIVLVGDQVVLTNGAQNRRPFVFQGNTLYLDAVVVEWAKITNVVISTAQIASARIEWAQIDNVNITSAMIGNATILTGNIAANAVTSEDNDGRTQATTADGLWYDLATVVIESPSGNPVKAQISVSSNITPGPGGSGGAQFEVYRTRTGDGAVNITNSVAFNQLWMDAVPSIGTYTYLVRGRRNGGVSGSVTANIIAECNKV